VSETIQEFPEASLSGANPALETLEAELPPPPVAGLGKPQAVVAVCLCGVFAFLNLYVTQPMLPMFERTFGASKSAAGLTVSAATLGVALSATVFGAMAERLSRKRVIVLSILALAVPTLLAATSPGLHALIFWRFLQGLVMPGIFAITITYVGEEWPREAIALVMSIYVSGTALGGFTGRLIGGLTAERLNWHWSFVFLGGLTLIGAGVIWRWLPTETRPLHGHAGGVAEQLRPMLAHLRNPRLLATFGAGFGMLFALVGTFTYVTFYLADPPFGLSTEQLSWLFAIYLVGLLVTPLGGYMVTRIGMREGIACAIGLCVVVFCGLGLVCTGVFIAQSTASSFLRVAAPEGARASAAGLYLTFYYLGGTAGGVVPGYVWSLGKWPACVALIAVLLLVILVLALVGWKEPRE
jgi:YNFM family putative membrane transporter